MAELTHTDDIGKAKMVDVSAKTTTERIAKAQAIVMLSEQTYLAVKNNYISKGDVLAVARISGIMAGKKTSELIPLCHNIPIDFIDISFNLSDSNYSIKIISTAKTSYITGIEMEAMVAASVAALTIYDMCKGMDKSIEITDTVLLFKSGGKSGEYRREGYEDV